MTQLKYYFAMPTRYRDTGCVVSRTGYTGEDGFEVMVPNALAVPLWEEFVGKGAVPCGLGARDTLRLEAAMPLYGHELNETIDPIQAGLGWAVKLDKGDFIGRAGAGKTRRSRTPAAAAGRAGSSKASGRPAKAARSSRTSNPGRHGDERQLRPVAGEVDRDGVRGPPQHGSPGPSCSWTSAGRKIPASVVPLPFYKRKK